MRGRVAISDLVFVNKFGNHEIAGEMGILLTFVIY
jgi:hypothetical protein